jgi:hypothetical protein
MKTSGGQFILLMMPVLCHLGCNPNNDDYQEKRQDLNQDFSDDFDPYGDSERDSFASVVDLGDWSSENRTTTIRLLDLETHQSVWSMQFLEEDEGGLLLDAQIVGSHIVGLMMGSLLMGESDEAYADKFLTFINSEHEFEDTISLGIDNTEQGSGTRGDPYRGEVHHSLAVSTYDADNNVAVIMRTGTIQASEYVNSDPELDFVLTETLSMLVYPKDLNWVEEPEEIEVLRLHEIIAEPTMFEDDTDEPNPEISAFELFHANGLRHIGVQNGRQEFLVSLARINTVLRFTLPESPGESAAVTGAYFGANCDPYIIDLFVQSSHYQNTPYPIYKDAIGIVRDTATDTAMVNGFTYQHGPDLGGDNYEMLGIFSNNTSSFDIVGHSQALIFQVAEEQSTSSYSVSGWSDVDIIVHSFGAVTFIEEAGQVVGGITSTGVHGRLDYWELAASEDEHMTHSMDIQYQEELDFGHILPGEPEVYIDIAEFYGVE